jgi:uncharacterized membrane protein
MESQLTRLQRRVEELEQRLALVEGRLGIAPAPEPFVAPLVEPEPEPVIGEKPVAQPPPLPMLPPPVFDQPVFEQPMAARMPVAEETGIETKAGLAWLSRVGAVTMILAVAFGFKAAVDNDLIGPAGRIICGLLAGALTLFAGDKLWHRGHKVYSQGVTSLGICIFYLSFYAAFQLYELVPQSVAFAGALVTTLAAGALALRYDARVIAILALLGGYASPLLVSTGQANDLFFGSYLVGLNAIALTLARRKLWLSVELTAAVCTCLLHLVWFMVRSSHLGPVMGGSFVTLQYLVFVHSPHAFLRWASPLPAMVALGVVSTSYSSPVYWAWSAVVSLAALALAWRTRDDRMVSASLVGWVAGFIAWITVWADPSLLFAALTAAFLVYLAVTVLLPMARRTSFTYSALALNGIFYYVACYSELDKDHHAYMGLLALAVAACYLGVALYLKKREDVPQELLLVCAGVALSFVTLAIPIQLSGYSITLAWAVESAVLAYVATRFESRWPFLASWVVGFLAVAMVLGSDAERAWGKNYSPIVNARFIPFVVVSLCLALNAYWTIVRRRKLAAVPLLAAHFVMLVGLHTEAFAWIGTGHKPGADLTSQEAVASTMLLALYGFALVAHGILKGFRLHRLLGLSVFALVIAKLYLYDIWQLNWLYKGLAFGALGAMLFSGSYLYSRYRERLMALWKDEPSAGA